MQELHDLKDEDLRGLAPETVAALAHQMLQRLRRQDGEIKFKDAKIEKITFQLAQLKAWKFGAKTESMSAEQKRLFEETLAEDEASLQAQLEQARGQASTPPTADDDNNKRKPRRQPLPDHLRRVEHHHEPDDTNCPSPGCGKPMKRVGEDVSERLDIIPAEFFVHRHIYGKWACRCCQCLVQEAAAPQIIDGGMPATGLVVHTMISRFVDHVPYYRQEAINARSGVHTPRSTLASWSGRGGAALEPLFAAQKRFVLSTRVLHADETPVPMLDPGAGKTKRAYVWAYARGAFDAVPGVVYDFCLGRGSQYPIAFLGADDDPTGGRVWSGTLVRDEYKAYEQVMMAEHGRIAAGCLAHARRKFDELLRENGKSAVATEALQRIARIYRIERELATLTNQERLARRTAVTQPLWEELHKWLRLERARVHDGSATAKALNYSLNAWEALTRNLLDGEVNVDNNHCENLIRPWALGRKAWLFAGSELAGQRAAIVMSLVQSAKINGHDPHAYLNDVLTRLPTHLNSRIDELLPHNWRPSR
ncbi:transposase [Variovorax boronicumulans]|uniref:IS66 family transposase n=1 Tax=Variovorax boronicumulans TaxID=436515 RepID=UPI00277E96CF|nr:IS66 family transposase [Variovorax boronicumulans]MDP9912243.1 transposase [Variovorax boronicumulans]